MLREARFLGLTAVSLPLLGLGGSFFTWMLFKFRLVQILLLPFWLFFRGFAMPGTKAAGGQGAAWRPTDPRRYPSTWPVMDFSILK